MEKTFAIPDVKSFFDIKAGWQLWPFSIFVIVWLAGLLSGCGEAQSAIPSVTATPIPTITPVPTPTAGPTPTAAPVPANYETYTEPAGLFKVAFPKNSWHQFDLNQDQLVNYSAYNVQTTGIIEQATQTTILIYAITRQPDFVKSMNRELKIWGDNQYAVCQNVQIGTGRIKHTVVQCTGRLVSSEVKYIDSTTQQGVRDYILDPIYNNSYDAIDKTYRRLILRLSDKTQTEYQVHTLSHDANGLSLAGNEVLPYVEFLK